MNKDDDAGAAVSGQRSTDVLSALYPVTFPTTADAADTPENGAGAAVYLRDAAVNLLLQFFAGNQVARALKQRNQNCAGLIR